MTEMNDAQVATFQRINDNWPVEEYYRKAMSHTITVICEDGDKMDIYQDGTTSDWYQGTDPD